MKLNCFLIPFVCMMACPTGASAQATDAKKSMDRPAFSRLSARELRVIQGMGQAVLAAQQNATDDPVQAELRNEMRELGAAVEHSLVTVTPHIQLRDARADTAPEQRRFGSQQNGASSDRYTSLRNRLIGARLRADRLRSTAPSASAVDGARATDLLSKAIELQNEVGAALDDAAGAETSARLAGVRERLRPKTLREILAEREAADREAGQPAATPTPTLSTIVRHR